MGYKFRHVINFCAFIAIEGIAWTAAYAATPAYIPPPPLTPPPPGQAAEAANPPGMGQQQNNPPAAGEQGNNQQMNQPNPAFQGNLEGLGFGVALGVIQFSEQNIETAAADANKIVRVSSGNKTNIGIWLETHYFFPLGPSQGVDAQNAPAYKYGWGFFLGAQAGDANSKILQAVGLGLMAGARKDTTSSNAFSVGIGYAVSQIHTLADGLTQNQPLPTGITDVTTKTKVVGGPFIISAFTW